MRKGYKAPIKDRAWEQFCLKSKTGRKILSLKHLIVTSLKISKKGLVGKYVLKRCLKVPQVQHNSYLYDWRINAATEKEKLTIINGRGADFENRVEQKINKYLNKDLLTLQSQWELGGNVLDFVLFWKDVKGKDRAVLFECKHSTTLGLEWKNRRLRSGIKQIQKYQKKSKDILGLDFDLTILLIDFPILEGGAINFHNDIVILNFSLLDEFILGLNNWSDFTSKNEV